MADNATQRAEAIQEELANVEKQLEEQEKALKLRKAMSELFENENFKTIVLEEYMENEADRIKEAIITPDGMKRDQIEMSMEQLMAIRMVRAFFAKLDLAGMYAEENVDELRKYKRELESNPDNFFDTEVVEEN